MHTSDSSIRRSSAGDDVVGEQGGEAEGHQSTENMNVASVSESQRAALTRAISSVVPRSSATLPYPEGMVPLRSSEGLRRLEGSVGPFEKVAASFRGQGPLQCGVTSLTVALNVCRTPTTPPFTIQTLHEELRAELKPKNRFFSVSLGELGVLASRYALARTVRASQSSPGSFRAQAVDTLAAGGAVIVNFGRAECGYPSKFAGHCSPIGAYCPRTDEFLVMDVAVRSFQPVWVPCDVLFQAMNTIEKPRDDAQIGTETRGFMLLGA